MKIWPWIIATALLAGCQNPQQDTLVDRGAYQLETLHQAQGADQRIRFLVMHYTAEDFHSSLKTLTDEHVSAHYLLPAHPQREHGKPTVYRLVPEAMRAACRHQRPARPQQPQRHLDRHRNRQQGLHPQHAVHPLATLYGGADRRADPAEPRHCPTLWYPAAGRGGAQRYRAAAQAGSRPAVPRRQLAEPVSAPGRTNETCSVCWRGAIVMRRYRWCRCSKSWRVTAMRSTRHGMRGSSAMWWRRFRCTSGPTMCAASRMQRVKRLSMRCW